MAQWLNAESHTAGYQPEIKSSTPLSCCGECWWLTRPTYASPIPFLHTYVMTSPSRLLLWRSTRVWTLQHVKLGQWKWDAACEVCVCKWWNFLKRQASAQEMVIMKAMMVITKAMSEKVLISRIYKDLSNFNNGEKAFPFLKTGQSVWSYFTKDTWRRITPSTEAHYQQSRGNANWNFTDTLFCPTRTAKKKKI